MSIFFVFVNGNQFSTTTVGIFFNYQYRLLLSNPLMIKSPLAMLPDAAMVSLESKLNPGIPNTYVL